MGLTSCSTTVTPTTDGQGGKIVTPVGSVTVNYNMAYDAGKLAAKAYTSLAKPAQADVANILSSTTVISSCLQGYPLGGYASMIPTIQAKLPNAMAKAIAANILVGIDTLFSLHPEWITDASASATVLNGFLDGVDNVLASYAGTNATPRGVPTK